MNAEEQLIKTFYTNFQQRNWRAMLDCYTEDVFFYDPVFGDLEGPQVRGMWEMLLSRPGDLQLEFDHVSGGDGYGSCNWTATYIFTPTGKKVVNRAKAHFTFNKGRISEHQDEFSVWKWSSQALGLPGMLFGWTGVLQKKIRSKTRIALDQFLSRKTN
jgi:ketosteroid isomerase-like protein